jgi:hypothetical protein
MAAATLGDRAETHERKEGEEREGAEEIHGTGSTVRCVT